MVIQFKDLGTYGSLFALGGSKEEHNSQVRGGVESIIYICLLAVTL